MDTEFPFNSHVETVHIGNLTFRLRVIDSLDEAIEFYAETAPENADLIPYYTMLWDAAKALARHLVTRGAWWKGKRVLELGCGLGVPSLTAAGLGAEVTATDYHPHNEPFFRENLAMNSFEGTIRYVRTDWRRPLLKGPYDVILGSDLIYEQEMVAPLVSCVGRLCSTDGVFMLADPGRDHLQKMCSALEDIGFEYDLESYENIFLFEFRRYGVADPRKPG